MTFPSVCDALYPKKDPYRSKSKFVFAMFRAAGGPVAFDDSYARKLFNGDKSLTDSLRERFPDPVKRDSLRAFFDELLSLHGVRPGADGANLRQLAQNLGIRASLKVERPALVEALVDWFDEIVHQRTGHENFEAHYVQRLEVGLNSPLPLPSKPLYPNDRIEIFRPPATQTYVADWYEVFVHTWTLKNTGTVDWKGRYLKCENPKGLIRPMEAFLEVPDRASGDNELVILKMSFKARGTEGRASSQWRMYNQNGEDCFPGERSQFDVVATVTNPNATSSKGGK